MSAGDRGVSTPVLVLLIWLVGASGTLLLVWGSKLSFLLDDWEFLVYRHGWRGFVDPHNEHIVVLPMLVYKALLATIGMGSALPFRVVSVGFFLLSAVLLFVFLRRRVGQWPALAATAVVLFLGAAWEDLLWAFQIGYFGSMACGLGALLALEREDRRGDLWGTALLVFSVLFSSLGLPFLAAVAVLLGRRRPIPWKRAYIVAVAAAVYALWWLGWGHEAESALSLVNVAKTPVFVLNGFAASFSSAFGLNIPGIAESAGALEWGRPFLVAAVVLALWRLSRLNRVPSRLWVVVALAGAFWILAGLNQAEGRSPVASRYQYIGVIFTLMIAAELLRGVRIGRGALVAIFAVALASIAGNVYLLHGSYRSYHQISVLEKADLAAVEITREKVSPGFVLSEDIAGTGYVHIEAGAYLAARDAFGSPAYNQTELAEAPASAREAADKVIAAALEVALVPTTAAAIPHGPAPTASPSSSGVVAVPRSGCLTVASEDGVSPQLRLPLDGALIEAGSVSIARVELARYSAEAFPVALAGTVPAHSVVKLDLPPDRSSTPWRARLQTDSAAVVCGLSRDLGKGA